MTGHILLLESVNVMWVYLMNNIPIILLFLRQLQRQYYHAKLL